MNDHDHFIDSLCARIDARLTQGRADILTDMLNRLDTLMGDCVPTPHHSTIGGHQ